MFYFIYWEILFLNDEKFSAQEKKCSWQKLLFLTKISPNYPLEIGTLGQNDATTVNELNQKK